ncbi:hypothetical protein HPY42_00025 [Coprothermobacteraceae bacterium]|nr:hypothetical protein [Coprothermobacteraceae bacterium]
MWKMLLLWLAFSAVAVLTHVVVLKLLYKEKREDGRWIAKTDLAFKDYTFVVALAFLWLILASMGFEEMFTWSLPLSVIIVASVVPWSTGLLLSGVPHSWSRWWAAGAVALWLIGYMVVFVSLNTLNYSEIAVLASKGTILYKVFPIPALLMALTTLLPFPADADRRLWRSFLVVFLLFLWVHTFFYTLPFLLVCALALILGVIGSVVAYYLQEVLES